MKNRREKFGMNSIQKRYTKTVICTRGKKYNMIDWRWFFFSSFDSSLSLSVSRCEFVCVFNAHFTIITIRPPRMKIRYSLNTLNSIRELNTVSLCVHRATYIDWTLNGLYAWRVGRMVSDSLVGVVSYYYYFFRSFFLSFCLGDFVVVVVSVFSVFHFQTWFFLFFFFIRLRRRRLSVSFNAAVLYHIPSIRAATSTLYFESDEMDNHVADNE